MESHSLGHNVTTTMFNEGKDGDTEWTLRYIVMAMIWGVALIMIIYHFRTLDDFEERERNRQEMIEIESQEREAKIHRLQPKRREKVIASVIVTKRVTKKNGDGGMEFSEHNNLTLTQQNVSEISIPNGKHPCAELRDQNIEICNNKERNTKKRVDKSTSAIACEEDEETVNIPQVSSISSYESCDSFSENMEKGIQNEEQEEHRDCAEERGVNSLREDENREETNSGLTCPVCLDDFDVGDELSWSRELKCRHVFHSECLLSWLMKNDECPVCRTVLIEEEDFIHKSKEGNMDGSVSETLSFAETESLDSSSGVFFVLNGMVSLVRNAQYSILEKPQRNIDNSICDKNMSTSERQADDDSLEGCVGTVAECETDWRKGSQRTSRGKYNIIQSAGGDEEENLSTS